MDIIYNTLTVLMYLMIFISIVLVYIKKFRFSEGLFLSSLSIISVYIVKIFIYNKVYSTDLITESINNVISVLQTALNTAYTETEIQLPTIDLTQIKNMYTIYFPSLIIIYSISLSWIIHIVSKYVLILFKRNVSHYPSFSEYRFPKSAFWILVITYILSVFITNETLTYAIQNINLLLIFFAIFCGLSFVDFHLRKKIKFSFVRALIYIIFFTLFSYLSTFAMMILLLTALSDSIFDLRKKDNEVQNG